MYNYEYKNNNNNFKYDDDPFINDSINYNISTNLVQQRINNKLKHYFPESIIEDLGYKNCCKKYIIIF